MTDDLVHSLEQRDAHAQRIAQIAVKRYEPLRTLPERDAAGILMLGYRRRIEQQGVTPQEADYLLLNDLRTTMAQVRPMVFPLLRLNEVRTAVLLHLAFVLGVDALRRMAELWHALRCEDYDAAADAMLLSDWPTRVGHTPAERRRAVDLVNMMRTGRLLADVRGSA